MGTIANLANRFKALNFELIKQEALRETVSEVPELIREQLKSGQRSDGNPITPKLDNIAYALKKEAVNGLNGRSLLTPDLLNTGSYQEKITSIITAKTIKSFSLDLKSEALDLKYGEKSPLLKLNEANTSKYALDSVKPVLFSKLKAATVG